MTSLGCGVFSTSSVSTPTLTRIRTTTFHRPDAGLGVGCAWVGGGWDITADSLRNPRPRTGPKAMRSRGWRVATRSGEHGASEHGGGSMRVRTDDGVELAVEIDGSGPGLLLVHGHGGAKEDFADHVDRLSQRHTVVTFDHRGHGTSDHPTDAGSYSLARMRADTWAVADAVGLDRFRILGRSMGGMVVRRMPLEQPERIEALVMMDTSAGPIPTLVPELVEIGAYVGLTEGKDALKTLLDSTGTLDTDAYL